MSLAHFRWPASPGKRFVGHHPGSNHNGLIRGASWLMARLTQKSTRASI
jgi:hypothetical protein